MKSKVKRNNWIIGFVCSSPIIFLADMKLFTEVTTFIREPNDIGVAIGLLIACASIFLNFLLIKLIIKKTTK